MSIFEKRNKILPKNHYSTYSMEIFPPIGYMFGNNYYERLEYRYSTTTYKNF